MKEEAYPQMAQISQTVFNLIHRWNLRMLPTVYLVGAPTIFKVLGEVTREITGGR